MKRPAVAIAAAFAGGIALSLHPAVARLASSPMRNQETSQDLQ